MYGVYLVDDDTLILEELVSIVPWMDNGFGVIGSQTDPEKAYEEILVLKPEAVFCDLKMPGMDGNELINRLKNAGCQAEFVMLSAYDAYDDVRAFYRRAGYDYILKPVDLDDMQMVLEGLGAKLSERYPAQPDSLSTNNEAFNGLVAYVDEHYGEKITLESLSAQFGFSRNYICELFAKHYNMSLTHYITDIRMKAAARMLKDNKHPVKDVAISCGYANPAYFYRVFKAYYGKAVGDYREDGDI